MRDFDLQLEEEEAMDSDLGAQAYGLDIDDDMDEALPKSSTPSHSLIIFPSTRIVLHFNCGVLVHILQNSHLLFFLFVLIKDIITIC